LSIYAVDALIFAPRRDTLYPMFFEMMLMSDDDDHTQTRAMFRRWFFRHMPFNNKIEGAHA